MQSPVENPSPLTDVCGLDLTQPMLFTVPGILTPTECLGFIARIEAGQPTPAPITTHRRGVTSSGLTSKKNMRYAKRVTKMP